MNDVPNNGIFPKGNKLSGSLSKNFVGQAWIQMLVTEDGEWNCTIGNVTFEPGCRNNWHRHPGGQILLITGGRGWYQEYGKEAQELHPGDVVKIPANAKHWHGAAKDSWFTHLFIATNADKGPTEWMEPVSVEDYESIDL